MKKRKQDVRVRVRVYCFQENGRSKIKRISDSKRKRMARGDAGAVRQNETRIETNRIY